ncbi:MAG TPA: hypothetical protein VML19_31395 [Verrucomicrobiae bacterium]|nr:hypothetical protein [Verrucomicrobiae bacterium]
MLKFGIYRADQFGALQSGGMAARIRHFFTRGRVSIQLLDAEMPLPLKVELFERVVRGLRQSNGTYRTSFRGRFRLLDDYVNQILRNEFDAATPLDVHDWAASDCSTSAEWAAGLFAEFPRARLTASDLTTYVLEAALPDGDTFILEANLSPMQFIRPPFVLRLNPPEPPYLPVNWLLCRRALARLERLRAQWAIPADWWSSGSQPLPFSSAILRKISMVHPNARQLMRDSAQFAVRSRSAFEPLAEPCHVVRTMNILNRGYFDEAKLQAGVRAVWLSLRPGGIWIVGRTWQDDPPRHRASVFRREGGSFQLLDRYEEGSEIDDLVRTAGILQA